MAGELSQVIGSSAHDGSEGTACDGFWEYLPYSALAMAMSAPLYIMP